MIPTSAYLYTWSYDVERNDIFGLKWIYYGPKRDILDYWETLIFCLLSHHILGRSGHGMGRF